MFVCLFTLTLKEFNLQHVLVLLNHRLALNQVTQQYLLMAIPWWYFLPYNITFHMDSTLSHFLFQFCHHMGVFPRPNKSPKFKCLCIIKSVAFPSQWLRLVEKNMHTFTNIQEFAVGLGDDNSQHTCSLQNIQAL